MDKQTLRVLEFEKILNMAAALSFTSPGRALVAKTHPLNDPDIIRKKIVLISECRKLLSEGLQPGIEHFEDLTPLFQRVRPENAVLDPLELRSFLPLFSSAISLSSLGDNPLCPTLGKIVSRLTTHPDLRKAIDSAIDRDGFVRDDASYELSRVRKNIKSIERKIKGVLERILQRRELARHLQDFFIAERNKRYVIPVKKDSKGNIPGIIHDISNTGETVYVEPYSIQNLGNDLESNRAEEKLEVHRILKTFSDGLREHLGEIVDDYSITAEVDALQSAAALSDQLDMIPPEINEKGHLKIIKGRHPLLWKTLRQENRETDLVPLDLEIGKTHSCMVITGSNTGGKTVALKTAGVLHLMGLSGMHIPAEQGTTIPLFENIFADIGDEQSIEQHLSTFSAHINRISEIIRQSSMQTLVIIDELGTGTDPEQGGALSCAILRRLKQKGALTVISTHLGMLKAFAHSEQGLINSAMEMKEVTDHGTTTFLPTYRLITGEPGTSHAFDIAKSLGLEKDVISEARQFMTDEGTRFESLISELKQKTSELNERLKHADTVKHEASLLRSTLKKEHARLAAMKNETLLNARKEAEDLLRDTRKEAARILKELKQSHPRETEKTIRGLEKKIGEMKRARESFSPPKGQPLNEVKEGMRVFIHTLGIDGTVDSVQEKAGRCRVLVEGKEIIVPLSELSEPLQRPSKENVATPRTWTAAEDVIESRALSHELKIIGLRVDPALSRIERFLNDASLAGLKQVRIIHGIGSGRLARAVREYVRDHPLVEDSRKGNEEEGGEAVTIVFL
jgi:DNA mismatch repair protein MutS2